MLNSDDDACQGEESAPSDVGRKILLSELALRRPAHVVRVVSPQAMPEWEPWLTEIGFLPGESVMVLTRHRPGGDPLVVRIGDSTFALRRAEAACIEVALASDAEEER